MHFLALSSGTFCTLDICLSRLEDIGTVDVKQTVRRMRTQRAFSIQTWDQYYFCYKAVIEYAQQTGRLQPVEWSDTELETDSEWETPRVDHKQQGKRDREWDGKEEALKEKRCTWCSFPPPCNSLRTELPCFCAQLFFLTGKTTERRGRKGRRRGFFYPATFQALFFLQNKK